MGRLNYIIIPIFLNNAGCPDAGRCVFCNQAASGGAPCEAEDVKAYIENFISALIKDGHEKKRCDIEIAFYGGTFTALSIKRQGLYFESANAAMNLADITKHGIEFKGFRVATRPDYINDEILSYLKKNMVKIIEIGVESFNAGVLEKSGRGYGPQTAAGACESIKRYGFELSVHLMCGLPGQDRLIFKDDVARTVALSPDYVRIHPLCVLSGSKLGGLFNEGKFKPRPDDELIEETAYAMAVFELNKIKVIRAGILENDNFRKQALAGPAYPNLREIAEGLIHSVVYDIIREKFDIKYKIIISVLEEKILNYLVGYKKNNIIKNNDLFLEFKNKMLYNNDIMDYILISAENNEPAYALTRPGVLMRYIKKLI